MLSETMKDNIRSFRRLIRGPDVSQKKISSFLRQFKVPPVLPLSAGELSSLAIVVPCFCHERYLNKMLESIVSQTRPANEVIFVDDCSPDHTGEIIERFIRLRSAGGPPHYSLLRNDTNIGQAASLNLAISIATSELVLILNDDDYLMHDLVENMFLLFDRHRDIALVGGTSIHFCEEDKLEVGNKLISSYNANGLPQLTIHSPAEVTGYRGYNDLNMGHSGCCFLKSVWKTVGGYYPEKKYRLVPFSDRDFQLRINALYPVAVSSETPFAFWRSDSSVDNRRNS